MGWRFSLSTVLAILVAPSLAHARDTGTVRVGGSCVPAGTSSVEIIRILQAELSPMQVEVLDEAPSANDVVLAIDACNDAPPSARISVWRAGERRERIVVLADAAPGMYERTLALALAEALRDPATTTPALPRAPPLPSPSSPSPPVAYPDWRASSASPSPAAEDAPRSGVFLRRSSAPTPFTALVFRWMPAVETPALGIAAGIDWSRASAGVIVLGARRTEPLGTATLFAIAGSASYDAVDLGAFATARISGELGAAIANGSPGPDAVGRTQAAVHAGLQGGVASTVAVGARFELQGFVGGGYASSLNVGADGQRIASLGGGFVTLMFGVGFP
ncbi:MAG TPA: hypothetical protein VHU80_01980 [Polyangiaceae bacterium]|nr:hypothetical protein [Polyangiaceae bacterium]